MKTGIRPARLAALIPAFVLLPGISATAGKPAGQSSPYPVTAIIPVLRGNNPG